MEYEFKQLLGCSVVLGGMLGLSWVGACILSWAWGRIWAWVDDSKAPERIWMTAKIMAYWGWREDESYVYSRGGRLTKFYGRDYWEGAEYSHGFQAFIFPLALLIAAPVIFLIAYWVYPLTIGLALSFLIAHMARFARRHKKLFDQHVKDPDAHK